MLISALILLGQDVNMSVNSSIDCKLLMYTNNIVMVKKTRTFLV